MMRAGMERPVRVEVVVPVFKLYSTHAGLRRFELSDLFVIHPGISSTGAACTAVLLATTVGTSMLSGTC